LKIGEVANQNWLKIGGQGQEQQPQTSFSDYLKDALNQVTSLENQAGAAAQELAVGDETQIHQVMIAYEKASLALGLTIEIRNKMVEAYQEIMRIQM
jgi:flagellar hook-basal body complex protein FliE